MAKSFVLLVVNAGVAKNVSDRRFYIRPPYVLGQNMGLKVGFYSKRVGPRFESRH